MCQGLAILGLRDKMLNKSLCSNGTYILEGKTEKHINTYYNVNNNKCCEEK